MVNTVNWRFVRYSVVFTKRAHYKVLHERERALWTGTFLITYGASLSVRAFVAAWAWAACTQLFLKESAPQRPPLSFSADR